MKMKPNILMDRHELGNLPGQGTFAKVNHIRSLNTSEIVSIKSMDKGKISTVEMMEQIKRQIYVIHLV